MNQPEQFLGHRSGMDRREGFVSGGRLFGLAVFVLVDGFFPAEASELSPVVVREETITTCLPPNNGAGPLWCYGSPLLVRSEGGVFVSVMETGKGIEPFCNTRWRIFHRDEEGWKLVRSATDFRLREPSPLAAFQNGSLFLSITPSIEPPGTHYGRCEPQLLVFDAEDLAEPPIMENPKWSGDPYFTDHSYRGIAADGSRGELLWLNIDARTSLQHWSLRDREGKWPRQGAISFPIRACYPQVGLKDGAAHVLAIGDIVEPIEEWRAYKHEQTGREWDYVFRRLFYAHTPDIWSDDFSEPIEIDSVESTAGHIRNLDLWIGPDGACHLLYLKSTVQSGTMRDRFFPGLPILQSLEYTVMAGGKMAKRETLLVGGEGDFRVTPAYGRFQATPDGKLWAVYSATVKDGSTSRSTLFLMRILPSIDRENPIEIILHRPFGGFFTACERGGSRPSYTLDLFGQEGNLLRYAEVRLKSN